MFDAFGIIVLFFKCSPSQVRGFCVDLSNHDIFTTTNVYGDIIDSNIHHNYYGHYSYGHQGGVWTGNQMHSNLQYGKQDCGSGWFITACVHGLL